MELSLRDSVDWWLAELYVWLKPMKEKWFKNFWNKIQVSCWLITEWWSFGITSLLEALALQKLTWSDWLLVETWELPDVVL